LKTLQTGLREVISDAAAASWRTSDIGGAVLVEHLQEEKQESETAGRQQQKQKRRQQHNLVLNTTCPSKSTKTTVLFLVSVADVAVLVAVFLAQRPKQY
jgi:hypothetical protein